MAADYKILKDILSEIGDIEVFKDDYVFTLLLNNVKEISLLRVRELLKKHIKDKPVHEICVQRSGYILIILKPTQNQFQTSNF